MASRGFEKIKERMGKALSLPISTHNLEDVIDALNAGDMQAFWNDDAIVITEVCQTPRRQFVNIFLAAGTLEGVYALQPQVSAFATSTGVTEPVQMVGRPGWGKHLKKRGWKKQAEVWVLPMENWNNG